jgi:hypothetical protein
MKKKATLLTLLSVALLVFGCTKENPDNQNVDGHPLRLNNFALCDGNQLESGNLQYTIYGSFNDWLASANPIASGSSAFPVEIVVPELEDGQTYYYDLSANGSDNWFGGNIFAKTESNFSFTYSANSSNTMVPKLYNGATDLLGQYLLSDIVVGGISSWGTTEQCMKDNFISISKDFTMLLSEGSEVCTGGSDQSYEFYFANCMDPGAETLESFESDWLSEPGNQQITFDKEGGQSRLTLTCEEAGATVAYEFVRQ